MDDQHITREEKISLLARIVQTIPGASLRGDKVPYCAVNGYRYCYVWKDESVVLRLPAKERIAFIETYETGVLSDFGQVFKQYVVVPDGLLLREDEFRNWFTTSHLHVSLLKPRSPAKTKVKKD